MRYPGSGVGRRRFLARAVLAAAATALCAPATAAPDTAQWKELSSGITVHGISNLRIATKGSEVWYARAYGNRATRMGLVRSHDRGKTWESLRQGLDDMASERDAFEITLDPKDERTFYVATRGKIYKTTNAGQSFEPIGSGTQTFSLDRSQNKSWVAGIAVDPSNAKRLVAGTLTEGYHGGVFESKDAGKSWTQIAGTGDAKNLQESGLGHDAWPISLDRSDKYLLVGGTRGSAWFSDDRGVHFKLTQPGGAGVHRAFHMTPMQNREVFLAESRGLWKSRDAGASWGKAPLLPGTCISVDVDEGNRKQVYAILRGDGLWHTTTLTKWEGPKAREVDPHEVHVHPTANNTVLLTSLTTGLWISTDKGETFKPVLGNLPEAVPPVTHAAVHGADATHMMAVTDTGWVFASQDRGTTWTHPGNVGGPVTRLVGASASPRTWLAAGAGVIRSEDLGKTWDAVLFSEDDPEDRVVDLEHLPDGQWLAVWERSASVFVGKDAGEAWADVPCTRCVPSQGTWASDLAVDPKDPKHWLLATRTTADAWSRDDRDGGPYETKDGGQTWTLLDAGLRNDKGVYREGWNRGAVAAIDASGAMLYGADGVGLFRWVPAPADGSAPGWTQVALSSAPGQPSWNAFATGAGQGDGASATEFVMQVEGLTTRATLRSTDGGATWTALPDPGVRLASLAADPTMPGRYLSGDVVTDRGVLVFERPGATPPPAPAAPVPAPVPERPPPPAPREQPPGGLLAFSAGADGQVKAWSLREGKSLPSSLRHAKAALAVALSKDESRLYTAGADRVVSIWNGSTGESLGRLEGHGQAIGALAVSPDGAHVYSGDEDYLVYAWDVTTGKAVAKWEGHTGGVTALAVSPDGRRVYSTGRDRTVRVWDAEKGKELLVIPGHPAEVLCLALSADGARLYTGARDAAVRAFDTQAGKPLGTWATSCAAVTGLALSPDGALLYVAGDAKEIAALSTTDGKKVASYPGGDKAQICVAVSADGHWIVAGGEDGLVRLWRAGDPAVAWTSPKEHEGWVHAVVLTPDVGQAPPAPAPGSGMGDGGMAEPTPPGMGDGGMGEPSPPGMNGGGMGEAPPGMGGA